MFSGCVYDFYIVRLLSTVFVVQRFWSLSWRRKADCFSKFRTRCVQVLLYQHTLSIVLLFAARVHTAARRADDFWNVVAGECGVCTRSGMSS